MLNVSKLVFWGGWLRRHHFIILPKLIRFWLRVYHCCDIPLSGKIDKTVYFNHNDFGIVINPNAEIHEHVDIQHSVTIGIKYGSPVAPVIEDHVVIGAKAVILGDIRIGHHAVIGAATVVIKDVPPYAVVVGNPAKIIRNLNLTNEQNSSRS